MSKKRFVTYLLVLSMLVSILPANLYAQAASPRISSIRDIEIVAIQGKYFKLPTAIDATLSDNKVIKVAVKWNQSIPQTSKIGVFTFKGSVKGYNKPITLTLHIITPIISIKNLETTVSTNEKLIPPAFINAVCQDKSVNKVPVTWKPSSLDTNKPGRYTLQGTVPYYSKKVILTVNVNDLYTSVENLNITLKHNQTFTLPSTVKVIALDNTQTDAKVTWIKPVINTSKVGKGILEGLVKGYSKKVFLNYEIVPFIASVPEKNISFIKGDIFTLPSTIEATMSDGSKKALYVSWTPPQIDLQKVGTTEVVGMIEGYDKLIKWVVTIKPHTFKFFPQSQYYSKAGYIALVFSEDLIPCTNLAGIILKDENDVQIRIQRVVPGLTLKTNLLIVPAHELEKNKTYTLTIPKNTIQAVDGDLYPEDITVTFKVE